VVEANAILARYEATTPAQRNVGRRWYADAHDLCRMIGGAHVPVETVARVMAILSPRCLWRTNVAWTRALVTAFVNGDPIPAISTGANRHKAWRELHGERVLSGPKTTAFARAIAGDPEVVVIDSWMLRSVGLKPDAKVTPHRQRWISAAYTEAARAVGETPRDMQAIVWCAIRGKAA